MGFIISAIWVVASASLMMNFASYGDSAMAAVFMAGTLACLVIARWFLPDDID
jgi:hypothetical protein